MNVAEIVGLVSEGLGVLVGLGAVTRAIWRGVAYLERQEHRLTDVEQRQDVLEHRLAAIEGAK